MLSAKLRNYWGLFRQASNYPFISEISPLTMRGHVYTLAPAPAYEAARQRILRHAHTLFAGPRQWLFTRHPIWVAVNGALALFLFLGWRFRGQQTWGRLALLACLPLGYYLTFLPATVALDFRYFYAATLGVQAAALGALFGWAFAALAPRVAGR